MSDDIVDIEGLEACLGKTPGGVNMKVIDHLDHEALRWLALSPLTFVVFGDDAGPNITIAGGVPGFATAVDASRLQLPLASLDAPHLAGPGVGFGALFLVPGVGETLRVNGRVAALTDATVDLVIDECLLHCAKALIRSAFWQAAPAPPRKQLQEWSAPDFFAACRFMVVGTIDANGRADVSPKGDPAGLLLQLQSSPEGQDALWYADRPGNRRADSFRNLLSNPHVALLAMIPGENAVTVASGVARLSGDASVCASFTVDDKVPRLVTGIMAPAIEHYQSGALTRANLWPAAPAPIDIDPAAIFAAHVTRGLQAALLRAAVSVPGMMASALRRDYRKNLY